MNEQDMSGIEMHDGKDTKNKQLKKEWSIKAAIALRDYP